MTSKELITHITIGKPSFAYGIFYDNDGNSWRIDDIKEATIYHEDGTIKRFIKEEEGNGNNEANR